MTKDKPTSTLNDYKINVVERLILTVDIKAKDVNHAIDLVRNMYESGNLDMSNADLSSTTFMPMQPQ